MLRAKRRRTRMHGKDGNPIFNTMNSTPLESRYKNQNNKLKRTNCCNGTKACKSTSCGTTTIAPEFIIIDYAGSLSDRDSDLIINGRYTNMSTTNKVYYNKNKQLYLGLYSGTIIGTDPSLLLWGIGYEYPTGTSIPSWLFMRDGDIISGDNHSFATDGEIWTLASVTQDESDTTAKNINNNFIITAKTNEKYKCCVSGTNRTPLPGYRKQLICTDDIDIAACPKEPKDTIYKDNYARVCGSFRKGVNITPTKKGKYLKKDWNGACGYSQTKPHIQNRNGWINDKYNYNTAQYLERRCRSFNKQAFNFLSNQSIADSSGSEFLTGCLVSNINTEQGSASLKCSNICKDGADCCQLKCNNILGVDCSLNTMTCNQLTCAKKGYTLCEANNNNCKAVYKRSNQGFSTQGAVSGGSRINRLKYQTVLKSQSVYTRLNARPNVTFSTSTNKNITYKGTPYAKVNTTNGINSTNGTYPVSLYKNTYPRYKSRLSGLCLGNMGLTLNNKPQRCKMPLAPPRCKALQTLPQKCNFRCAPKIHHDCRK